MRQRLVKEGIIKDFTVVPDFAKMGFQLLAINFAKIRPEVLSSGTIEKAREYIAKFPNTIFASTGEGLGMNAVSISFFRDYAEYQRRVNLMKTEWKDIIEDIQSFIVAIGEGEFKRFSLTYLGDMLL